MKTLQIRNNQFLSDVISFIPSDKIIFKNITGIGATTLELGCERNSIIIEPNVPVIEGKCKKYSNALGIYQGVSVSTIAKYLKDNKVKFKKIITTPESFTKLISAGKQAGVNLFEDFFLLFDECDKLTKDALFRETITDPLDYFFQFKQKAFISATALRPSDPRFSENGFTELSIVPDYQITKKLHLIATNNPYVVIQQLLKQNHGKRHFIFFNSIRGIEKLISYLKIEDKSAIFCSDTSLENITLDVAYSSTSIDEENFCEYNFLTSRFFTAVDIDINYDCNVYMFSDVHLAEHSVIDPNTDAIQILGRFRNPSISMKAYMVSNTSLNLNCRSIPDARKFLFCTERIYECISVYKSTVKDPVIVEVFNLTLEVLPFNEFLDSNKRKSYFKLDNYLDKNRVLNYYLKYETLSNAFKNAKIQNSDYNYFQVDYCEKDVYMPIEFIGTSNSYKFFSKAIEQTVELLYNIDKLDDTTSKDMDIDIFLEQIKGCHPLVYEAYKLGIPKDSILKCSCKKDLENLIKEAKRDTERKSLAFIKDLRIEFRINDSYTGEALRKKFKEIIQSHNLGLNPTLKEAGNFFEISDRYKGKAKERDVWKYKIKGYK